ncbi:MAG: hypothetical protein ACFFAL_04725 [Promethearchaeota archaeon]
MLQPLLALIPTFLLIGMVGVLMLLLIRIRYPLCGMLIGIFNPYVWVGAWVLKWLLKRVGR